MLRIKELREEKNISQLELAKKLNLTQQSISLYEKGDREPSIDVLKSIANFFNVSLDYLLGKSDIRNYDEDEKEFRFAFHKEIEGMTDEEIKDALRFYKEMKNRIKEEKKDGSK